MKLLEAIQSDIINHILNLCKEELELDQLPPISLIDDDCIDNGEKRTFGQFDGDTIEVITKNRHPMDTARTICHELVHWKQKLEGKPMDGSDGSDVENEAHAVAGYIMRKFSERYPDYFINSLPY